MIYKDLKLKTKDYIEWTDLPIPPKKSKFFVASFLGQRGSGKTYSMCQLIQNIDYYNFYNKYYFISPTLEGDLTQRALKNELESKNRMVFHFEDASNKVMAQIREEIENDINLFNEYHYLKQISNKYKKLGFKKMKEDELFHLIPYIDEENGVLDDSFLDDYPEICKRKIPPCSMLILDDTYGSKLYKQNSELVKFLILHRHKYTSICLLLQSLSTIPRSIRGNTILWIIFPSKSKKTNEIIYEENDGIFSSFQEYLNILDEVSKENHGFLYIDSSSQKEPDLRIGFNKPISLN